MIYNTIKADENLKNELNANIKYKYDLKILKNDWTEQIGDIFTLYYEENNTARIIADVQRTYPPVLVDRAFCDGNGNNIGDSYLKKADANNMFNTNFKSVSINEYDKYFGNTWSYAGANGLSIDSGTWLICYYAWFSANSDVDHISLRSTRDDSVGITAPSTANGTFMQMQEILSGTAISNLLMYVYVPKATTFGQVFLKSTAIKLC